MAMARRSGSTQRKSARKASRKATGKVRRKAARKATGKALRKEPATRSAHPTHIVVFHEPSEENVRTLARALRVTEERRRPARPTCAFLRPAAAGRARTCVYRQLAVAAADLTPAEVRRLARDDRVQAVVRNEKRAIPPLVRVAEDVADTVAAFSWGLEAIGIGPGHQRTGAAVPVAVLDTGIDASHPDFEGQLEGTRSFVGTRDARDGNGHGTHCAGIVAALVRAGVTRHGVAPGARLLIGKVLDDRGDGMDDRILEGIDWAADAGARVISLSLGGSRKVGGAYSVAYERVAQSLLETGVLIVAAAGNDSRRPHFTKPVNDPAACPSILAVAAVDRSGRVAPFSCAAMDAIGEVDLSAPGVGVRSSWPGGGTELLSGTSMATPHVAGVAALELELRPRLGGKELWERLVGAAKPLEEPKADVGAGLVQAP